MSMADRFFEFLATGPIHLAWIALFAYSLARGLILLGGLFALYWVPAIWRRKRTPKLTPSSVIKKELLTLLGVFILDSTLFVVWIRLGLFRYHTEPTPLMHVGTVALLFVWVEIWFYGFHRLIHHPKLYWIHRTHHRAIIPNPFSAFSFSLLERFGLFLSSMLFVAVAGLFIPMTLNGILWYFVINVLFTALGHTDLRIYPDRFASHPIFKYITDPTQHSLHHSKFLVNFGLFTNVLDRVFGTYVEPAQLPALATDEH